MSPVRPNPTFDIDDVPFSRRGSWLDISPVIGLHRRHELLHLVSHQTGMHPVLRFVPSAPADVIATASALTWVAPAGRIDATFETTDTIRMRGRGLGLTIADAAEVLTPFTGAFLFRDPTDGAAVFTSYETGRRYRITVLEGAQRLTGDQRLGAGDRAVTVDGPQWEVVIEEFDAARAPYRATGSFEDARALVEADFAQYLDAVAPWWGDAAPAAALAAYVLWSATVAPRGFVSRESVLMSKHWMDKVWSWDHCFTALALAEGRPLAAFDNLMMPFDHQEPGGAIPDSVAPSEVLWNYVKPPIHGWALKALRERTDLDRRQLTEIHGRLAAWSGFWLGRRAPGHALPHYHHGNDSGWDNSTTFDRDRVIESPDLAALLAVQLHVLADLTDELGLPGGQQWRDRAQELLDALQGELWRGTRFVGRAAESGRESTGTSLLGLIPLLAAEHLRPEIVAALVAGIGAHLTEWGLATEPVDSTQYEPDGYWRGPIWAPSTLLLHDGLRSAGRHELADEVSARFRRLCERSGFAENFDAVTGAGLRDRAYTWTAAVYLILAAQAARATASDTVPQSAAAVS
ncbi:MAG TPA: glycogen debranching protein [Microbacterium sp.]|uniref:amylo-alpha-1,6-glucosidase n=1 Tax=Microbacterium sp. TaxID=51671 RepID=UPI002B49119F|nr:glycogen debranching protein [Microbacterium sp.]HKT57203.1 glycogen debranching protein [Microbacterium sp.]